MMDLRTMLMAGAVAGMVLGQGVTAAQAGPLLDRATANPAMQTAALEPMHLSDETMDDVSAGVLGAAILFGLTLATVSILGEGIHHENGNHSNHGCRGINCHNDP